MIIVYYKKKQLPLPDSFNELESDQYIRISELLFNGGDELKCYIKALRILANMSRIKFMMLDPEMIDRCLPFIEWVFKGGRVTRQLVPSFRGYYGPASDFDNLKMKEFHFSEQYFREIVYHKIDDSIDKLIAVLYRHGKARYDQQLDPDGDVRMPFNENQIEYYSRKVSKWPDPVKHAIFFWYHSCRHELIANNELVFTEPEESYISRFDTGLYGVMRSLAGDKLGSIDKVEQMYIHTAMLELGLLKEEEQRIDDERKSNTPS